MALTNTNHKSSWISSIGYIRTPDVNEHEESIGWLVVFTANNTAILYKNVPKTLPGLLVAGQADAKDGERSVGATYNRLVRGRYQGQTITEQEQINFLKGVCKWKHILWIDWPKP